MEIFKYIPGIKFREVTASASIYVALGELFALGEFSRWLINIFRPLSRKLWEVLVSYLPLDIILSVKEKDALTALLLFSPLGFVGIYHFFFNRNRNDMLFQNNLNIIPFGMIFASVFFIILLFDVISMEEYSKIDLFKKIIGVEVDKHLTPIVMALVAINGPTISRFVIENGNSLNTFDKIMAHSIKIISCFFILNFLIRFPDFAGISLVLILIYIIVSVRYVPRSYVTIMIIMTLMTISGVMVDFVKDVISQV